MRTQLIAMVAVAWLGGVGWSCSLTTDLPKAAPPSGDGGAGGMSSNNGGSGIPPCDAPTDCPGNETDCSTRTCDDHVCGETVLPTGTPLTSQVAEDCLQRQCDDAGMATEVPLDSDARSNANLCKIVGCDAGMETVANVPLGTMCSTIGNLQCDGNGNCVECIGAGDCALKPGCNNSLCNCSNGICLLISCLNGAKGELETDVDCGGLDCPPCSDDLSCLVPTDCASMSCGSDLKCLAPTCSDNVANGLETDLDCGGPTSCPRCVPGKTCAVKSDCDSLVCKDLECQAPACDDGQLNGDESDIDCGGLECNRCGEGKKCREAKDCRDGLLCKSGKCVLGRIPVPRRPQP